MSGRPGNQLTASCVENFKGCPKLLSNELTRFDVSQLKSANRQQVFTIQNLDAEAASPAGLLAVAASAGAAFKTWIAV